MSSVQALREFIHQRLTAAAGEIFTVFEQTVVQYQEEIERQRRLLQLDWKPVVKLHRAELPQYHDCRKEQLELPQIEAEHEEPGLQQFKEEPKSPQIKEEQEEPEPPQIEEHNELGSSQEVRQFTLKFESLEEQSYLSEPEEVPDTNPFLFYDSEVHSVKKHNDLESTTNAKLKKIIAFHSDRVDNFPVSEKQDECEKLLREKTRGKIVGKKHKICQTMSDSVTDKKKLCEICGESYRQMKDLMEHLKTHTGENPDSCEACGKTFRCRSSLFRHMRTHTGEKPYSCEACGRRFRCRSNLLPHMRTHTGEKPYSCETCGRSFSRRNDVLVHMRIHTGEKPYSCEICGKRFTYRNSLLNHMKSHKKIMKDSSGGVIQENKLEPKITR